jgi:hypothetical protein
MKRALAVSLLVGLVSLAAAGRELVVVSAADNGQGTLRWALESARNGDTITFDPARFPLSGSVTISLQQELPVLWQGRMTIDASDAGVIIDGAEIPGGWSTGITISSDRNVIMGLQIVNFAGSGIALCTTSHNTVGGDRTLGGGPIGRGNLISANSIGIDLCDQGTGNVITGNLIGTHADGVTPWSNRCQGIWIENGMANTTVGPNNVICSIREEAGGSADGHATSSLPLTSPYDPRGGE